MKSRIIVILAALLGVQVLLAVGLLVGPRWFEKTQAPLALNLEETQVDRVEISDATRTTVLARENGQWLLPEYHRLPVAEANLKLIFERLNKLEGGTSVATSPDAYKRFKVADDSFERRVVVKRGDKVLATVFLGASAPRERRYLRVQGNDGVFEEIPTLSELSAESAYWANKDLFHIPEAEIASIQVSGLRLIAPPPAAASAPGASAPAVETPWKAEGLPAGKTLNAAAAALLRERVSRLSFEEVLAAEPKPEHGLDKPAFAVSVQRGNGEAREFLFGKLAGNDAYYTMQVGGRKEVFKLPAYVVRPMAEGATVEALTKK